MYGHAGHEVKGSNPASQATLTDKWLTSQTIWSVEELETLRAGSKRTTSHIDRLKERGV